MNAEDARFVLDLRSFFQVVNTMMAMRSDQVPQIHEPQVSYWRALIEVAIVNDITTICSFYCAKCNSNKILNINQILWYWPDLIYSNLIT